jgi:predicted nucleic acid-binding protein
MYENKIMKPKVYIETTILSYLTARPSNDLRAMANQNTTIEWWENRRSEFEIYISEFVVAELSQGDPEAAARRLAAIEDIPELDVTEKVRHLGNAIIAKGPIPEQSIIDAYHIAVAAVNGIDYLITWNCTHIANAVTRSQIEAVCRNNGFEPPIICTPQELMEG